jgi:hypothetical protein
MGLSSIYLKAMQIKLLLLLAPALVLTSLALAEHKTADAPKTPEADQVWDIYQDQMNWHVVDNSGQKLQVRDALSRSDNEGTTESFEMDVPLDFVKDGKQPTDVRIFANFYDSNNNIQYRGNATIETTPQGGRYNLVFKMVGDGYNLQKVSLRYVATSTKK